MEKHTQQIAMLKKKYTNLCINYEKNYREIAIIRRIARLLMAETKMKDETEIENC